MRTALAVLVCLAAVPSLAQDAGRPRPVAQDAGRSPPVDAGTAAAAAGPRAVFVLAKDSGVLQKWGVTRPEARGALPTIKTTKISDRLYIGLFLEGYELPKSRRVDLSADIAIVDCNGRTFFERAMVSWAKTMDPKLNTAVPLSPYIELVFGLTDPECAYTIRLTIFDAVRGTSAHTEGTFTLTR